MATTSLPTLPHATLTKITGEPKPIDVATLKREVYANAMAVPSHSGGGAHGHLGAVMDPAEYVILTGQAQAFVHLHQPAQLAAPVGQTQAQITERNRQQEELMRNWDIYTQVCATIKKQIIEAVDPLYLKPLCDRYLGYANRRPLELLDHLEDEYGISTGKDLETNRKSIAEAWNPDVPFVQFLAKIDDCRTIASDAGDAISDSATIELAITALRLSGVYGSAIQLWDAKDPTLQTFAEFRKHFKNHDRARRNALDTSRQAGFHQANQAHILYTPSGLPVDISHLLNLTPEQPNKENEAPPTKPPPTKPTICQHCKNSTDSKKPKKNPTQMLIAYCWTHGLTRANANHTSRNCRSPADGHQETATITSQQGGSSSIVNISGGRRNG